MKKFTVTFYSDAGHGWAKVRKSVLQNLNIADKVSSYSYVNGDYVFLEEDCDLPLLADALQKHDTKLVVGNVRHAETRPSRIRSYARYAV